MGRRARLLLKAAVWGVALLPLLLLLYRAATDWLGPNPISYATNLLGDTTLRLLLASLAATPLRLLFGLSWPVSVRRLLGLFAFFYACLHFTVWVAIDHFFDWTQMIADVVKRPYITVGMAALTLLVPLAVTSTAGMIKRLGAKRWRQLHRLVYAIGVLAVLHYLWLAKKGVTDPFYYVGVLALLMAIRLWDSARSLTMTRRHQMQTVKGVGAKQRSITWKAGGCRGAHEPGIGRRVAERGSPLPARQAPAVRRGDSTLP